jgi:hypothetical protein
MYVFHSKNIFAICTWACTSPICAACSFLEAAHFDACAIVSGIAHTHTHTHTHTKRLFFLMFYGSSPWWWRQYAPVKHHSTPTRLHGAMSQKALNLKSRVVLTYSVLWVVRLWDCECGAFWHDDVCCSVDCWTCACVQKRNNENSVMPVDDEEQLCCVVQHVEHWCQMNGLCFHSYASCWYLFS